MFNAIFEIWWFWLILILFFAVVVNKISKEENKTKILEKIKENTNK